MSILYCSLISVCDFIYWSKWILKLVPQKSRETIVKQKTFTSKWKKRDIVLADTMAKSNNTEQEKVEYSNAHMQSLHCVVCLVSYTVF